MSFNEKKRQQIKYYIIEKISETSNSKNLAKKVSEAFDISLNTAYRYIRELEDAGIIKRNGKKFSFIEKTERFQIKRNVENELEEEVVYKQYIKRYSVSLPANVEQLWHYAFTEMMNNALEHSGAAEINILVSQNYIKTIIMIEDNGVGIFRKIKEYYNYPSLDDAVTELFKGKLTTDKNNHSGEGIFFTSRALDSFAAVSDVKIFTHDKYSEMIQNLEDIAELKNWQKYKGTIVLMELSNSSNKHLKEVFDMFTDEDAKFSRTNIPLRHIFDTFPVSRSQARRLCQRFDKFQEVELDFSEIAEIGQGFAHEIFVVFQRKHPEIKLIPINTTFEVERMIKHVKNTIL